MNKKVFSNVYRHRVKLLACGLLVMISLLCYILKSHTQIHTIKPVDDQMNLIENNHVIRHHRILEKKAMNENFEISVQTKKRKSLLVAKPVEKSHIDIIDYYKQNEPDKNLLVNHIINNKQNNLIYPNNNLINTRLIANQNDYANRIDDSAAIEKHLKNLDKIVHIDLKGAPPKIHFFRTFIPMLKEFGANGILLEYEDMFPFDGVLADAKHGHAYTLEDINLIKKLAKENNLYIIPLVQTVIS